MKKICCGLSVLFTLASVPLPAYALSSHSYTIAIDAVANGGGTMSSTNYGISHLAGQSLVIGPVSSANYMVQGGFYYIHLLEELLLKKATCLVFDTVAIYAGFDGQGIWKSTDSGATWTAAATQPANMHVKGLVIHPTNRNTLFAASYGGGIFTSSDSGATWSVCANSGLIGAGLNAVSLVIDQAGKLYAGTEEGIFSSSNNCADWTAVNTGLTVDAATPPVSIVIGTNSPSTLYAGLDGAGVYFSTNSGRSWTASATQPGNLRIKAMANKPDDSSKLFAASNGGGVYQSTDSGDHWAPCATQPANQNLLSLAIDAGGKLHAGSEAGVFVSADDCETWTTMSAGLP